MFYRMKGKKNKTHKNDANTAMADLAKDFNNIIS